MKASSFPNVERIAEKFHFEPINPDNPLIGEAVEKYRIDFGLPETARPSAAYWLGVFDEAELVAVLGERWIAEDVIDVTDLYPVPGKGRRGVAAMYKALSVLRDALSRGVYKQMTATCLHTNKTFQTAISRVFGCEPMAVYYSLECRR